LTSIIGSFIFGRFGKKDNAKQSWFSVYIMFVEVLQFIISQQFRVL
jgi:hypothetical protein